MSRGLGMVQRKILLLLMGGVALGFAGTPTKYFRVLRAMRKEWGAINRDALRKAIRRLYESRLLDMREDSSGSVTVVLSEEGRRTARQLTYNPDAMEIKIPPVWDGKWRVAIFDIPTHLKKVRDAFRIHLQRLGLYQLQKSVFVYPHPCADELDFLIEFYDARRFVRLITAEQIDNGMHLERIFRKIIKKNGRAV